MCDFTGFIEPEMIKTRPVVVVKKHKSNPLLVTVVPLSATKPDPIQDYHYEFLHNPVPTAKAGDITWAGNGDNPHFPRCCLGTITVLLSLQPLILRG